MIGVTLVCLWLGYLDSQTDQYRYQSEEAKKLAVDFCANRVSHRDCIPDTLSAFQEQNYGQKDVRAQEHMAIYALAMFVATAIGVAFVARTLNATRQAVGIASETLTETVRLGNEQIKEAREATKETRRIGEAQGRAYAACIGGEVSFHKDKRDQMRFAIDLFNSGNSPAVKMAIHCNIVVRSRASGTLLKVYDFPVTELRVEELGAKETRRKYGKLDGVPLDFSHKIIFQEASISFRGTLLYEDVFEAAHELEFALSGLSESNIQGADGYWRIKLNPVHPEDWDGSG